MEDFIIPDAVNSPDEATRAALRARAESDRRYRRLDTYLVAQGYVATGAPAAHVALRQGAVVRSIVAVEYRPAVEASDDADSPAVVNVAGLVYGLEANGTTWATAIITTKGEADQVLSVSEEGAIEIIRAHDGPSPPR